MTPDDIKRLHYYERQFLRTKDFQDEQSYHIEMRRRHLIAHHSWGIIAGLEITQDKTSKVWAVQPGMAIDGYGREIVVFEPEPLNLTAIADQLAGHGLPALLKIWIAYQTELANSPAPGYEVCNGKDQYTRLRESFRLVYKRDLIFDDSIKKSPHPFQDLPDDPQSAAWFVYLGTITWGVDPVNPAQNIILNAQAVDSIDQKTRRYVGTIAAEVIAPDNTLTIRGKTNLNPPTTPPEPDYNDVSVKVAGTLHVTNYLTVGPFTATNGVGGIDVTGAAAELGFVKRSLTSWSSSPVAGDRFVWYNPDGTARLWTEKNGDLLSVTNTGNVGIGTATPGLKLDVQGDFGRDNGPTTVHLWGSRIGDTGDGRLFLNSAGTIALNGNVGIGTPNPTHKFHVVASEAVGLFESTGSQAYLRFQTKEGPNNRVEITNRGEGRLSLWTVDGGDALNITKSGNVGIRTIAPNATLDVAGSLRADSLLLRNGTTIGKIQSGTAFVGSNSSRNKQITVNFPTSFFGVPKVMVSARSELGTNNPDTFAATVRVVSQTQFTVNLVRVDQSDGWAQNLALDWFAWE